MRGTKKPRAPANVSPDGQIPRLFVDAERDFLAALKNASNRARFARTEFNQIDKAKLRKVMYGEQGSLCVYCERRLSEGASLSRVEHWRPLRTAPGLAIHWNNLYLSCSTKDTCDRRKGARPLKANAVDPELPWPIDFAYECVVGFTTAGHLYVRKDVYLHGATRNALELAIGDGRLSGSILNLNHPTLREARRAALDSERTRLARNFSRRAASAEERAVRASQILDRDPRPEHVSTRVAWLLETLGRGL